jgi:hypothetical protein
MHVNLRNAYLCADCDAIGDSPVQCPACASRLGILPLITVLNRTQKEKTLYATNRQAEAEAIVRILHEVTDDDRSVEGYCYLCGEITPDDPPEVHGESCPFGMADEFIAKYGTHPPAEPRRA